MWTALLIGLGLVVAGAPAKSESQSPPAAPRLSPQEALARYNEKKARVLDTADAQWRLAEWCRENGLEAEATAHYTAVVERDPSRSEAWRRLGYKKVHGRWLTDAQLAEEAEQARANKEWGVRLKKIHKSIHRGRKVEQARAEAESIVDPRAVPAVYREFGARGPRDQGIAIQILGQIDTPRSSKLLALMAVYGKTPEVRRRATETLRARNPDDYLAVLVLLLSDPLKYEVRPVGGPGSPGVLFVEGQRANFRRFYAPPAPMVNYQPGDIVSYDAGGMPVLIRSIYHSATVGTARKPGGLVPVFDVDEAERFSARDMMIQAQLGAISAELQLETDVNQIKSLNNAAITFNDAVLSVARAASGQDFGPEPQDWRDVLAKKGQYRKQSTKTPRKPTLDELVPLAYQPQFAELTVFTSRHFAPADS